jgi:predicted dehydrogenase
VTVVAESIKEALRDEEQVDAVVLDSVQDAWCAAESGKHILVDARTVDSLEKAESLIACCKAEGLILAVSELPRHAPASQAIIDRLASGKLGAPGLLRVHRWQSELERSFSSIIIGDVDLALHLFRAMPTEIYATGRADHSCFQIHLGFPEGGMALLGFSRRLPAGQTYESLSLIGSRGAAYADDHHNMHLLFAGRNPAALITDSGNGRLVELREFVDCVARGTLPVVDGGVILTVHRVTAAIGRSLESTQVLHERGGQYEPA